MMRPFGRKLIKKRSKQEDQTEKKKWAKFMYVGKETRLITKLFKTQI
jgi:hypothetical protein